MEIDLTEEVDEVSNISVEEFSNGLEKETSSYSPHHDSKG
jgi:hypothetical protein